MRIHHLNCTSMCPKGGHFMDGMSPGIGPSKLVCHCLLIESEHGLVLVDTGFGTNDVKNPERINGAFRKLLRPQFDMRETAVEQIKQLGFSPNDVRHIICTHLDFDHAGGIDDFPKAEVHLMENEKRAITKRNNFVQKGRYCIPQLSHINRWITYYPQGEKWFGFHAVRELEGLPPEILLVPLYGHTEGHTGVAVQTDQGWLLHAGDAYFYRGEMDTEYHCTPGLRAYQKMMEVNRSQRLLNQRRLRGLVEYHSDEVKVFSAHDAVEYLSLKEGPLRYLRSSESIQL